MIIYFLLNNRGVKSIYLLLFKREVWKKRYTRSESSNDDLIADDIIKNLVDKEFDLENCLTRIRHSLTDEKLVSNPNGRIGSDSSISLNKSKGKLI